MENDRKDSPSNAGSALSLAADSLLSGAVAAGDLPGVIAAATTREEAIYQGAFGVRALARSEPMSFDTVVWLASMTKPITSVAALQLIEQGKLRLDDPAAKFVPEISQSLVLDGFDERGEPQLRAPKQPVTVRHLMNHTSGFAYSFWDADQVRWLKKVGAQGAGTGAFAGLMTPLASDPGVQWHYGTSTDWLGRVVEGASGNKLDELFSENIFGPLGMSSSAFRITPEMRARLASVHLRGADGRLSKIDFEMPQDHPMGGSGLYSTAGDYLRFIRMILNGGRARANQLLRPESIELLSRDAISPLKVSRLKSVRPERANDAEFFPGLPKSWSLGLMINEAPVPGGRSAGSLGWAGMANTYFWIDRARGIGGVYLAQILPFVDVKSEPLFSAFEKAVYQSLE